MSQIKTTEIEGDVAVGRHVAAGGNLRVQGHATVKKNLRVEGWLDARNIKGPNKGIFLTAARLREAYPRPHDGWWALVGDTLPAPLYVGDGGEWVNTGKTAGDITVDADFCECGESIAAFDTALTGLAVRVGNLETAIDGEARPAVTLEELDGLTNIISDTGWWQVVTGRRCIGHALVTSDPMSHCVIQVLFGNYTVEEGTLTQDHHDGDMSVVWRSYGLSGTLPQGEWSQWQGVNLSDVAAMPAGKTDTTVPGAAGAECIHFDGITSTEGQYMMSTKLDASSEGCGVVYDTVQGRFLLRHVVDQTTYYYGNWPSAGSYGERGVSTYIEPFADRLYIDDAGHRMWAVCRGVFAVLCGSDTLGTVTDCGQWTEGRVYRAGDVPDEQGSYVVNDVWRYSSRWRCRETHLSDEGNGPGYGNELIWQFLGTMNPEEFTAGFVEGDSFIMARTASFRLPLTVRAVYRGEDVTRHITDNDVEWSRYSENEAGEERVAMDAVWNAANRWRGKDVVFTEADCQTRYGGYPEGVGRLVFTVVVTLRDPGGGDSPLARSTMSITAQ